MLIIIILSFFSLKQENCIMSYQDKQFTIINDEFANRPFGAVLLPSNIISFIKTQFKIERRKVINEHSGKIDSLLIYKSGKSKFCFYKNEKQVFFQNAIILDSKIKLSKGIEIGQSLDSFKLVFKIKKSVVSDMFIITDSESYTQHKFYFKQGKLEKIELNERVD